MNELGTSLHLTMPTPSCLCQQGFCFYPTLHLARGHGVGAGVAGIGGEIGVAPDEGGGVISGASPWMVKVAE